MPNLDPKLYQVDLEEFRKACERDGRINALKKRITRLYGVIQGIRNQICKEKDRIRKRMRVIASYRQARDLKSLAKIAEARAKRDTERHNRYLDKIAREQFLEEEERKQKRLNRYGITDTGQENGHVQSSGQNSAGQNQNPIDQGNYQTGGQTDSQAIPPR